jgi:hypothetical protein
MQVKIDGMRIMVGMPLYGSPTTKTDLSLLKTQSWCMNRGIRFDFTTCSGFVTFARDEILQDFLKSDADKLFWIDGDMTWKPEDFGKMVALSTLVDIVCAGYPLKQDGGKVYIVTAEEDEMTTGDYGLLEIHGTGLGFSIWSREVCQALSDSKPVVFDGIKGTEVPEVFCVKARNGMRRTEDINAFEDIRALGFKVWLDPTIELGHVGAKEWRGAVAEIKESA